MLTVLVADDEFAVLEVLSLALEAEGHRVFKAGDGADALRIVSSHPCDVIICDESMPIMNGHQLIEALRAEPRLANIPVILMVDRALPLIPDDEHRFVVGKPVVISEVLARVAQVRAGRFSDQ